MDIIFLLIAIAVIISKTQKKKEKDTKSKTAQPVPNQPKPNQARAVPDQPRPNQSRRNQVRPNQPRPAQRTQPSAEERLKMQNLKAELQKKHGSAKKAQQKPTVDILLPKEENIVNRAADNVLENDADILRMQMDAVREDNYGSSIAGIQMESPLMKEVEDLMIKGYSGGLTNPRDFVAEGIALLNSYELQETE